MPVPDGSAAIEARTRPDWLTLAAFVGVVLIGGSNFVAVRFSDRELPPFLGAGIRFGLAAVLMLLLVRFWRIELPRGRALVGAGVFGVITFTISYALAYYALVHAQAGLGAVFAASAPLLTMFLASAQRVERFRVRGLLGSLFAIVGVLIMARAPSVSGVPLGSLLALLGLALCISESGIIVKQFPRMHPVALNAVAMAIGTPPLLLLSLVTGEQWRIPTSLTTWLTLAYVVPVGSVLLFILIVYVLNRWTASALSYATVLFPVVSFGLAALLAGEALSPALVVGAAVTIVGVYLGALRSSARRVAEIPESLP